MTRDQIKKPTRRLALEDIESVSRHIDAVAIKLYVHLGVPASGC